MMRQMCLSAPSAVVQENQTATQIRGKKNFLPDHTPPSPQKEGINVVPLSEVGIREYQALRAQLRESLLAGLTDAQQKAVAHGTGPLLVVAGPGSGKTTVIVRRIAHMVLFGEQYDPRALPPAGFTELDLASLRAVVQAGGRGQNMGQILKGAGVDPAALLVVTFTKAAADSMKGRAAQVAGPLVAARATFGTFHGLAYRILIQTDPSRRIKILEEDEQLYLIRQLMRQLGQNIDDDTVMETMAEISRMRAGTDHPTAFTPKRMTKNDFRQLWSGYQEAKAQKGALDFDDLLHEALAVLQSNPQILTAYRQRWRHVMVDEFQDTNPVQWELVRLLAAPLHNLCVVGDDDQSIYGWRGASPHFLLQFPLEFPKAVRVTLDINHRCPPPVVEASNRLVLQNKNRFGKVIKSSADDGEPVQLLAPADSLQEAEEIVQLLKRSQVPLSDWAVIYRTNQQAHVIAQVLTRETIPYRALGGLPNLYKRWPVQDVLCYLRAAVGETASLEQVINRPNRFISRAVMQEAKRLTEQGGLDLLTAIGQTGLLKSWQLRPIEELVDHLHRLSLLTASEGIGYVRRMIGYDEYIQEYCAREGGSTDEILGLLSEVERISPVRPLISFLAEVDSFTNRSHQAAADEDAVTLVTCHKAKGLEYRRVVVTGAVDKLMPHRGAEDVEEERRLMYVAMTRAQERLWLSAPRAYEGREAQPSPFIGEALGPKAAAWLSAAGAEVAVTAPKLEPAAPAWEWGVPKPKPQPKRSRRRDYAEPDHSDLPPVLEPGTPVFHERHGRGLIESIDPTLRRVIIDFGGKRLSLDLSWCLGSPQFFRVLVGD